MIVLKNKHFAPEWKNRAFDHAHPFNQFFANDLQKMFGSDTQSQMPQVNITEDEKAVTLELAAPGLTKEDLKVDLNKQVLTISAEKKEDTETKKPNYLKREFSYHSFKRSFNVSEDIEVSAIKASYENGILYVILPKKEKGNEPSTKTITIG